MGEVMSSAKFFVAISLFILGACAGIGARREEAQFQRELQLKDEAWIAARGRLQSMCPTMPADVDEYKRKSQLRIVGSDPFGGCDLRFFKLTNSPYTDDWQWFWLPGYRTIVDVHEDEARKKITLKIYEEYMVAAARHLAKAIDAAEITPDEHKALFNYAWSWMIDQTRKEAVLLRNNTIKAEEQDAAVRRVLANTGLALAAGLQAYGKSYARSYRPPTNCSGTTIGYTFNVTCY
jgi:hypothetical protein